MSRHAGSAGRAKPHQQVRDGHEENKPLQPFVHADAVLIRRGDTGRVVVTQVFADVGVGVHLEVGPRRQKLDVDLPSGPCVGVAEARDD